ncbi:male sterility protein-domain-containing protein [Favolaschia claudopus]|uniref:Fatty acyl-CoA reductase n=1 Tax=Favolaschia claudopus TaxID=2862362 RepID=A0AAW0DDS1_9AGAR
MDTAVNTIDVSPDPLPFFRKQTIFLTGGTGCLGGCILYKLAMKLDTAKIYVLVRGSRERGISQLKDIMPNQTDDILATKKVQFVVGDITKKNFGIDPAVLTEMARTVTIVIHSAASISLTSPQQECVRNNCLPVLELATIASSFRKLSKFVFVSTAYVNHHLPDGVVEEKIYPAGDAEKLLSQIIQMGTVSKGLAGYSHPVPYTLVKNLTEQLLVSRNPSLLVLIARPTIIAPAISQPYPYYTRHGSCPGSNYVQRYMEAPDSGIFHVSSLHPKGTNIFDEVPVDIAANVILLHIMDGTTGVIHVGAGSYVRRTLAQLHQDIIDHFPRRSNSRCPEFRYLSDKRVAQGRYAEFLKIFGRDWNFSSAASQKFSALEGPLSIALGNHDAGKFMGERTRRLGDEVVRRRSSGVSAKL